MFFIQSPSPPPPPTSSGVTQHVVYKCTVAVGEILVYNYWAMYFPLAVQLLDSFQLAVQLMGYFPLVVQLLDSFQLTVQLMGYFRLVVQLLDSFQLAVQLMGYFP